MSVLRSFVVGFIVAILIAVLYIVMLVSEQRSFTIVNLKDFFLGIGLMGGGLGFVGIWLRMRWGVIPMVLFGLLIIVLFFVGLFLVISNVV